jgi:glycosyltransferase involved in cell wall biosynthesis
MNSPLGAKKILFVVSRIDPAERGGEKFNSEIYRHLQSENYCVVLFPEAEIPKLFRRAPLAWLPYFRRFMKTGRDTIIFVSHGLQTRIFVPLLLTKLFLKRPIILIVHGIYYRRSFFLPITVRKFIDRLCLYTPDRIIAISECVKRQCIALGVSPRHISVVYPGVELLLAEKSKYDVKEGAINILSVGYVDEAKGYDVLLRALSGIKEKFVLRIAGDYKLWPRYHSYLVGLAETLGISDRVEFLGHVSRDRLSVLYSGADIFALPSPYEGFGIVFLEAAANGLAIVATTGGAIPGLFEDGRTALLVPPGDTGALRDAIETLMNDSGLRRKLGENASRMSILKRTWDDAVREVEAVISSFAAYRE